MVHISVPSYGLENDDPDWSGEDEGNFSSGRNAVHAVSNCHHVVSNTERSTKSKRHCDQEVWQGPLCPLCSLFVLQNFVLTIMSSYIAMSNTTFELKKPVA